jgi:hypothetical protein
MADLIRVSILGAMPGGEVWSINPVYSLPLGLALSTDELASMALSIDSVTVPTGLRSFNVPAVTVTGCRVEARTKTGVLEGVAEHARSSPVAGSGSAAHPFQTSLVASLRTGDSSARGKGRLYWPATAVPLSPTTLRILATDTQTFVTDMNTYLAAIRTQIRAVGGATGATLAVWSRTNNDTRVVLQIRAGDVADVQRRRRDALNESYQSATVSAV